MKKVLISALFLVIATLALHAQTTHHVVKLGEFTRLVVTDDINVVYRCDADSAGLAVFDCTEDIADRFVFSINKNGRLNIQFNGEYHGYRLFIDFARGRECRRQHPARVRAARP